MKLRSRMPRIGLAVAASAAAIAGVAFTAGTANAAAAASAPAPIKLTSSQCPADISDGQKSGCVTELQELLNKNGARIAVDGDFGPATLTAVKNYQSGHGLSVDGIVGPATKAALEGGSTPPPPSTGRSTNYDFARLVLADGGWPQSSNNITTMVQWMASEEPPSNWFDRDNPLNNGLGSGGGAGLGAYPNLVVAAHYVAANLNGGPGDYGHITADLRASDTPLVTEKAIWSSPWAGSHYGWGKDFYRGHVATVAAPARDW
ncbi:peptidoglycan-binding domain-containing protein [Catenulispora pinisilvae]|uniref:peptidoglycan-binding domain-containing protein n=1 Tax=Catenulispora pinisilvae TaxID=2705253 RepID=UPI001891C3D7|nr:peptidoglycan-binding domain-containing protein [Catenulispora pinisilvae]